MKKILNIKKFTLIELIIVIVVIGLLAGMALPKFIDVEKDAKVAAMDQDLDTLEKAVQLYTSNNDGEYPLKASKISITDQNLLDTLSKINDDSSEVYEIDMDKIKPYLERLKYTNTTTDTYLYSTKTSVAINEQGKIDSNGLIHYILNNSIYSNNITPKLMFSSNSPLSQSSFIISKTNNLYACGSNGLGQLGDGTKLEKHIFEKISLSDNIGFSKVTYSDENTLAIGTDGELYSWGYNSNSGSLGLGTIVDLNYITPQKVTLASGVKPKEIAVGSDHSLVIGTDNELYVWGNNSWGQLGDGTNYYYSYKATPTKITLPNEVKPTQIAAGNYFSAIIGNDGNLYTFGCNYSGQLGDGGGGFGSKTGTPIKITLASGVKPKQIACGDSNMMAIGSDGELYTWGYNHYGQLGTGILDNNPHSTPTKITLASGVKPTKIACGEYYSMAIGSDEELYTWGDNQHGQLGNGTTDNKSVPTKIELASGVKPTQISGGYNNSMAIGNDDNLYCWGNNSYGELGDGTTTIKLIPTKITYDFK